MQIIVPQGLKIYQAAWGMLLYGIASIVQMRSTEECLRCGGENEVPILLRRETPNARRIKPKTASDDEADAG